MREQDRQELQDKMQKRVDPFLKVGRRGPTGAWLKEMRLALGIPADEVAYRANGSRSWLYRMEEAEAKGWIPLEVLQDLARGMECWLVYGLVPWNGKTVEEAARSLKGNTHRDLPSVKKRTEKRIRANEEGIRKSRERMLRNEEKAAKAAKAPKAGPAGKPWQGAKPAAAANPAVAGQSGAAPKQPVARTAEEMGRQGVSGVEALRGALRDFMQSHPAARQRVVRAAKEREGSRGK